MVPVARLQPHVRLDADPVGYNATPLLALWLKMQLLGVRMQALWPRMQTLCA